MNSLQQHLTNTNQEYVCSDDSFYLEGKTRVLTMNRVTSRYIEYTTVPSGYPWFTENGEILYYSSSWQSILHPTARHSDFSCLVLP